MGPRATHQITGEQVAEHLSRGKLGQQRGSSVERSSAEPSEAAPEIIEQYKPGADDDA